MKYQTIVPAKFIERPNRFVAYVELWGRREKVHVKNTGRCRELLLPGAQVYLEKRSAPGRATAYDLVAVENGGQTVNIDSQAPNKVVGEWLLEGGLFSDLICVRPETVYGNSRFDFYVENRSEKIFVEVKGVTLKEQERALFPDAPSQRAVKHLEELIVAKKQGYRACVIFVIQMKGVRYLLPNRKTHRAFAEALRKARSAGVELYAYECLVTPDGMEMGDAVPVYMEESEAGLQGMIGPLLQWYDDNKRILPWRETPTAYRVWVSEIMLQQTRVEAVKPYFERFMDRLPDVATLAAVSEEELLKLWEGLGFYNRARNLQRTAVQVVEQYGGCLPADYETLIKLPGIGSYTAGAIASIAYGRKYPAVDGNVLRVLSRIRRDGRLISEGSVKKSVEEELLAEMPGERPGDFNQALMELGACVCVPNGAPHCGDCPLRDLCEAHASGEETEYPRKKPAAARSVEEKTVLIVRDEGRVAIRKRPERGLLAGMYEFPSLEGLCTAEEVTAYLARNGLKFLHIQPLEEAKHIFSHREWHMRGYMVRVDELERGCPGENTADWIYIRPEETKEKFPIPAAFAAYTKMLDMRLGKENL